MGLIMNVIRMSEPTIANAMIIAQLDYYALIVVIYMQNYKSRHPLL